MAICGPSAKDERYKAAGIRQSCSTRGSLSAQHILGSSFHSQLFGVRKRRFWTNRDSGWPVLRESWTEINGGLYHGIATRLRNTSRPLEAKIGVSTVAWRLRIEPRRDQHHFGRFG
jgi:hypothetical protein